MNSRLVPVNASTSGTPHRQKHDLIRPPLRPFEQKWYDEDDDEEDEEEEMEKGKEDEEEANVLEGKKAEMVRAMVEAGYDQESAFYALKLVNFRSVMAAIQLMASIKKNIVQQHINGAGAGIPLANSPSSRPMAAAMPWPEKLGPADQKGNPKLRQMHRTPTTLSPRAEPSQGHGLRQSLSFGPTDFLHQERPLGTIIRIERNQSERVERREKEEEAQKKVSPSFRRPAPPSASPSPMMGSPQPVQRIFIDPQAQSSPDYGQYIDQLNRKISATRLVVPTSPAPPPPPTHPNRSVSPLPESVAKRLKAGNYERVAKACHAPMFRFFMEQHIEKLTQQYHERNKRARQLSHEMETAGLAENVRENMLRLLRQKESKYLRMRRQKMNKGMFELIRHIGIGAFGKVTLVRKRDTDQIYAMKTLVKADVIQKQQAAHVKAERDILAEANSPWIVKLFFSFQDTENLYFIMEYVPGGDMMQLLINMGIFPESLARFYIAELTIAVEYVHSLGFIHRDIKPDNILIDKGGHLKLTDFGLCTGLRWTHDKRHYVVYEDQQNVGQQADLAAHLREDSFSLPAGIGAPGVKLLEMRHHRKRDRAHSVVGTGNYMAPEVIQRIGHTQLCDWWSVGVILYEMVYGRPPFMSQRDDPAETQYMIVHWRRFLELNNPMGARLSRHCVDCIARLCCDQEMRMGQRAGAKDIKGHPWFRGIDFANLRQSTPEYVPRVRHPEDTSNFDTFEVRNDEQAKGADEDRRRGGGGSGRNGLAPNFIDFTFRHFFSEGMGPPAARGGHPQSRPSLAPLMETTEGMSKNGAAMSGGKLLTAPQTPKNVGEKSPLSARTILQIGGPLRSSWKPADSFRPYHHQARLDEEEADGPEESQC